MNYLQRRRFRKGYMHLARFGDKVLYLMLAGGTAKYQ